MSAATVAPVGMYVMPLIASAERWIGSRKRWSGILARSSHVRQKRIVASICASAPATFCGATSSLAHESAQNARSPGRSTWRARTRPPSIPSARSEHRRTVWPAPLASAAWRCSPTSAQVASVRP